MIVDPLIGVSLRVRDAGLVLCIGRLVAVAGEINEPVLETQKRFGRGRSERLPGLFSEAIRADRLNAV